MADDQLSPSYSTDNGSFSANPVSCRPTRSVTIIPDSMSFSDRHMALSTEIERHGSSELRHRQNDWQYSVQRIRSGFLKLLPADSESTSMTWKSAATVNVLDVHKARTDNFEYPDDNADDDGCNDSITAAAVSAIDDDDFDDVSESTRSSYKPRGRGRGRYQLRFDVADMMASSVRVTVESDVIVVRADRKSSTSTTYERRVVKPEPVDRSKLRAFLSADGILTVEAPLSPDAADDYFASCRSRDHNGTAPGVPSNVHIKGMENSKETAMNGLVPGMQDSGWTDTSMDNGTADKIGNLLTVDAAAAAAAAGTHPRSASRQSHCSSKDGGSGKGAAAKAGSSAGQGTSGGGAGTDSPGAGSSGAGGAGGDGGAGKEKIGVPIFRDENGTRRMHLAVDLGSMYRPRDVIIQVIKENRIQIRAKHLEKAGERQSKNKFTKEYELGEKIETFSLQGGLTANGKLIVCAYAKGHGPVNDE